MIFIRYESFRKYIRIYPVTSLLLLANIVMFIVLTTQGGSRDSETLVRFGAMLNAGPYAAEYWRYFTAMFLHIGFDHLLFNCFALFVFAPPLERLLGSGKYALFYLVSGLLGNVVSELMATGVHISAGASGAIYGVYGAYLFIALLQRNMLDPGSRQTVYTILVFGLIYSFIVANINLWAHVGGLLAGFVLYALMRGKASV
ncbi:MULTISPECIES: rhomboid family intramembrane serine protease [unclassified Paenibacillus]|uniref:rhomboid family intramembrane serine protease n=1 Tax=unclassified Paenibacillus TaxID=185978 RepID=UPI001C107272|nr:MULTISPECIES: rhomboid family intramembrane serine protease [unclassified Paenibacillus]MBU5442095.1 rhomboid family intramembrane serine protease [Paenibacillus sp. MSJ-34]CAH0117587.1 Rhomboid protease GluP [Paenibacillus sp. CECT 9249]